MNQRINTHSDVVAQFLIDFGILRENKGRGTEKT